ncbi:hypothetical protein [Iodobacter fluviatilis]|uniref:hypothetical protein n=1 Tax=Iodobacter fluviatilis TaxID=537 RepID=UPI00165DFB0A|nr:hypothetical protein [Iodobacter fluviatilis]
MSNLCNGGQSCACLNDSDGNYKVYVASLMQAKALGSQVTIYSTLKNGFCHIGYISIS